MVVEQFAMPIHVPSGGFAGADVQCPLDALAGIEAIDEVIEMRLTFGVGGERLDNDVEMPAAGKAKLLSLFFGLAVAEELRAVSRQFAAGQLFEQIVLHAAAGQGALEAATPVAGQQGTHRSRRRSIGGDHGGQPARLATREPVPDLADDLAVYRLHGGRL